MLQMQDSTLLQPALPQNARNKIPQKAHQQYCALHPHFASKIPPCERAQHNDPAQEIPEIPREIPRFRIRATRLPAPARNKIPPCNFKSYAQQDSTLKSAVLPKT